MTRSSRSEAAGPDGYVGGMVVMDPVFVLEVRSRRMVDFDGSFSGTDARGFGISSDS